jgi:hypothetical protein
MADHDDWTADDDAQLRAALISLRADVEAAPLPDVRFVKARGMARRRQRLISWSAAAAAAAVVVGTVGYSQLGRDTSLQTPPAGRSSTTSASPSPTTPSSLDQPGALPLLQEWTSVLGLEGAARMTTHDPKASDFRSFECLVQLPLGQTLRQEVTLDAGGFQGGQTQFAVSAKLDPETVAEGIASDVAACQQGPDFTVTPEGASGWPRLFSYTAGGAGSGWFVVVPGAADVTFIQIADAAHPKSIFTEAQVTALAEVAEKRLARYGSGAASTTATSSSTSGTSRPKAINEKMPVSGPDPVLSSNLFVAASQWKGLHFAKGAATTAGPGALEGSSAIVGCEDDTQQAGVAGRVGVVSIRIGNGTQSYIGNQRVRIFDDVQAQQLVDADLARTDDLVMKGCTTPGGARTTTQAGPSKWTYLLTTKTGGETLRQWVGLTSMQTPGAVTTLTFHAANGGQGFTGSTAEGFAELDRLLALARQK